MAGFGDIVQRAFYLGVGAVSLATEKANELRKQATKLADEMVERGEMNAEEARKFVDEMIKNAQQKTVDSGEDEDNKEPRRIEIVDDDEEIVNINTNASTQDKADPNVDNLRQQVESLQEELKRLKNNQ
jgi:polyhydroxyalkanoate synthesis regulator phasin